MSHDLPKRSETDHMLLGREPLSFSFPDRRRDPFAGATNAVAPGPEPAPPTVESLKEMMSKIPEPEIVIIHKPSGVGMTEGQFLDLFFGIPRFPVPLVEPEKIGTAVPMKGRSLWR